MTCSANTLLDSRADVAVVVGSAATACALGTSHRSRERTSGETSSPKATRKPTNVRTKADVDLFFIHSNLKNPRPLSVNSHDIRSHVRKNHFKLQKIAARNATTSSAQALVGWYKRSSEKPAEAEVSGQSDSKGAHLPPRLLRKREGGRDNEMEIDEPGQQPRTRPESRRSDRQKDSPRLWEALDSYCSGVEVDKKARRILYYFTTVWMPSFSERLDDSEPVSRSTTVDPISASRMHHIVGFSPILPGDASVSHQIIRKSLQARDATHVHSLLASGVSHMRFLSRYEIERGAEPELFVIKAIGSLRQHLLTGTDPSGNDQLVLDLAFLVMVEYFSQTPIRGEVYWNLIRRQVIFCGGLRRLDPFIALFTVGADYIISKLTLSLPTFDFRAYPALVDPTEASWNPRDLLTANCPLRQSLATDWRLHSLTSQLTLFTSVLELVHKLPEEAFRQTGEYIRQHGRAVTALWIQGAEFRSPDRSSSSPEEIESTMKADVSLRDARELAYSIWFLNIGLSFVPASSFDFDIAVLLAQLLPGPADLIFHPGRHLYAHLAGAEALFAGTGWSVPDTTRLWISAFGVAVSETDELRLQFSDYFVGVCRSMEIDSSEALHATLQGPAKLPLDRIPGHSMEVLGALALLPSTSGRMDTL